MKKSLVLLLLATAGPIWALAGALIEVETAALYWRPCISAKPFALIGTVDQNVTNVKVGAVEPDFDWGVRVGAEYTDTTCNLFAGFHATRLWAVNRARLLGGGFTDYLIPTQLTQPDSLKVDLDIDYYTIDVRGGHTWACTSRLKADLYLLGRYAYMRNRQRGMSFTNATQLADLVITRGRFKGAGFGLGFGSRYDLWCGFRLRSDFAIGALYGPQLYSVHTRQGNPQGEQRADTYLRDTHTNCISFFDVRALVEYSRCFCDFLVIAVQLGWEYNGYPAAIPVSSEANLLTGINRNRIGFGGPFINAALRF